MRIIGVGLGLALASVVVGAQGAPPGKPITRLDRETRLAPVNGRVLWGEHRGRPALHLVPLEGQEGGTDQEISALLSGSDFQDGVIEVDVAGSRRAGYSDADAAGFKGFIGVSFRVRGDTAERFYLRPENTRLDNQLMRNRSTQYEATPDHPWNVLRRESPGQYESYVDAEAGAWHRLRIEVSGTTARLFVNGAPEPALVVHDLKHGRSRGGIALWTRISADAWFSNLRVTPGAPDALPRVREVVNGSVQEVEHQGLRAIRMLPAAGTEGKDENMLAILDGPLFTDGVIEATVSGTPRPGAPPDSRGFVGVSFRTGERAAWSEVFYLRPTNGRASEQVRRNRTVQYASNPAHPWDLLRREAPGVYEAHADVEAGRWTRLRIEVSGTTARLFVNGAAEPALVVTDLKRGATSGRIALWAHVETDAYFGPVRVTPR